MPFGSEKTENATEWSHEQETIVPNHSKEIRPNDRKEEHDQTVAERAEVVSQEEAPDPELEAQERARKRKRQRKRKKRSPTVIFCLLERNMSEKLVHEKAGS